MPAPQASAPLHLRTSPHIHAGVSVEQIMRNVVIALLPVCAFAVYQFGWSALALLLGTTAACAATEHLICKLSGKPSTVNDWSAVITGMLLALTLPPACPVWMAALGGGFGIAVGKVVFGGIGHNLFNPALVGRAFLQAAFPVAMTTWVPARVPDRFSAFIPSTWTFPFTSPPKLDEWAARAVDGFSGATPLAEWKFAGTTPDVTGLFTGTATGSLGETSALLILLCGAYLVVRGMMNWRIPAAMLLSAALLSGVFYVAAPDTYPTPWFTLGAGGLMLGAVFMASDMVASPVTRSGVWIYGALMGVLTVIIRFKGGLPEGVMYAILLGNAASPIIGHLTQPRPFGTRRRSTSP